MEFTNYRTLPVIENNRIPVYGFHSIGLQRLHVSSNIDYYMYHNLRCHIFTECTYFYDQHIICNVIILTM